MPSRPPDPTSTDTTSTDTTAGARAHARAQAGRSADVMPTIPSRAATDLPPGVSAESVIWDETVGPGGYAHKVLDRGTVVRLTDLDGDAGPNLVLFDAFDPTERLNVADTVKVQWQAYLGAGSLLLSDRGRVLASIVEDTSGCHDALCGSSHRAGNEARYGSGEAHGASPAARELLIVALAKHGLTPRDLPSTLSLFKGAFVLDDGSLEFRPGSGAGRHVALVTEMPVLMVLANVAHVLDPRPDYTVTRLRITAWRSRATRPDDDRWGSSPEAERAFLNTVDHLEARGAT